MREAYLLPAFIKLALSIQEPKDVLDGQEGVDHWRAGFTGSHLATFLHRQAEVGVWGATEQKTGLTAYRFARDSLSENMLRDVTCLTPTAPFRCMLANFPGVPKIHGRIQ